MALPSSFKQAGEARMLAREGERQIAIALQANLARLLAHLKNWAVRSISSDSAMPL